MNDDFFNTPFNFVIKMLHYKKISNYVESCFLWGHCLRSGGNRARNRCHKRDKVCRQSFPFHLWENSLKINICITNTSAVWLQILQSRKLCGTWWHEWEKMFFFSIVHIEQLLIKKLLIDRSEQRISRAEMFYHVDTSGMFLKNNPTFL